MSGLRRRKTQRRERLMQLDLGGIAMGLGMPPVISYAFCRMAVAQSFYRMWVISATGGVIGAALPPADWAESAASGASLILAAVLWWLSRRRKRKAPKLAGAKTRAILAAKYAGWSWVRTFSTTAKLMTDEDASPWDLKRAAADPAKPGAVPEPGTEKRGAALARELLTHRGDEDVA